MDINLHKTEPALVTTSAKGLDWLCLSFFDDENNKHKIHMPIKAMLTLGGMMAEVAHRRQLALATRDN